MRKIPHTFLFMLGNYFPILLGQLEESAFFGIQAESNQSYFHTKNVHFYKERLTVKYTAMK